MILSNYSDVEFVYSLGIEDFLDLIEVLNEELASDLEDKQDEMLFHKWGYELPFMKEYMTIGEYMRQSKAGPDNTGDPDITNDEIVDKFENIRINHQKLGGEGDRII